MMVDGEERRSLANRWDQRGGPNGGEEDGREGVKSSKKIDF